MEHYIETELGGKGARGAAVTHLMVESLSRLANLECSRSGTLSSDNFINRFAVCRHWLNCYCYCCCLCGWDRKQED